MEAGLGCRSFTCLNSEDRVSPVFPVNVILKSFWQISIYISTRVGFYLYFLISSILLERWVLSFFPSLVYDVLTALWLVLEFVSQDVFHLVKLWTKVRFSVRYCLVILDVLLMVSWIPWQLLIVSHRIALQKLVTPWIEHVLSLVQLVLHHNFVSWYRSVGFSFSMEASLALRQQFIQGSPILIFVNSSGRAHPLSITLLTQHIYLDIPLLWSSGAHDVVLWKALSGYHKRLFAFGSLCAYLGLNLTIFTSSWKDVLIDLIKTLLIDLASLLAQTQAWESITHLVLLWLLGLYKLFIRHDTQHSRTLLTSLWSLTWHHCRLKHLKLDTR